MAQTKITQENIDFCIKNKGKLFYVDSKSNPPRRLIGYNKNTGQAIMEDRSLRLVGFSENIDNSVNYWFNELEKLHDGHLIGIGRLIPHVDIDKLGLCETIKQIDTEISPEKALEIVLKDYENLRSIAWKADELKKQNSSYKERITELEAQLQEFNSIKDELSKAKSRLKELGEIEVKPDSRFNLLEVD